jgi:hypothetical protein
MTTSRTRLLSKPEGDARIPAAALAYMQSRAKRLAYDAVIREFKNSGITKAQLARRLGKGAPEISRMLGGPANWTIRTVAELLFAVTGASPKFGIEYPLEKTPRNFGPRDQFELKRTSNTTSEPIEWKFTPMSQPQQQTFR